MRLIAANSKSKSFCYHVTMTKVDEVEIYVNQLLSVSNTKVLGVG